MWRWRALFFVFNLCTQSSAYATLGQAIATVDQDQSNLQITRRTRAQTPSYTSHELANSLYTVTEYANVSGVVFAITWHGAGTPDLSSLFGSYYDEYSDKENARPRVFSRVPAQIETSNIVVRTFTRMRDLQGLAYVPSLLPSGLRPETLR